MANPRFLSALLLLCLAAPAAPAPTKGGAQSERKAILAALRVPVQKELKKSVVFKVDHLKTRGGWAFMTGVPLQPGGKKMDYRGTPYQAARDEGVFDDWVCALLRKKNGKWTVTRYEIGATDVVWSGWDRRYKAPSDIFPR